MVGILEREEIMNVNDRILFIVGMHNGGTTMFDNIIKRCKQAVPLSREGCSFFKHMPELGPFDMHYNLPRLCTERLDVFANDDNYDWPAIKELWVKHWTSHHKATRLRQQGKSRVFVEKSPSVNIFVAPMLAREFEDAIFLLTIRDPYAIVEGMHRRNLADWKLDAPLQRYAKHWIKCASAMKDLMEDEHWYREGSWVFCKYEDFCEDSTELFEQLKYMLPELEDLSSNPVGGCHYVGQKGHQPIPPTNFNSKQLERLSKDDIESINEVLLKHKDLLEYFEYTIIGT